MKKARKKVLMEDEGFQLLSQPHEYWVSWIVHDDCPSKCHLPSYEAWRYVDIFGEQCKFCPARVPKNLLGVWKLHNYDRYAKALRIRAGNERMRL